MTDPDAYFEQMLMRVIEESATEDEFATFRELVRQDPELLRRYTRAMRVHALLVCKGGRVKAGAGAETVCDDATSVDIRPKSKAVGGPWILRNGWKVAAAAAVLLAGVAVWRAGRPAARPAVVAAEKSPLDGVGRVFDSRVTQASTEDQARPAQKHPDGSVLILETFGNGARDVRVAGRTQKEKTNRQESGYQATVKKEYAMKETMKNPNGTERDGRTHTAGRVGRSLLAAASLAVSGNVALGGVIATNSTVPKLMDAGGTAADPAVYQYDAYRPGTTNNQMIVGQTKPYNRLELLNGSELNVYGGYSVDKAVGYTTNTAHNSLLVKGQGSVLNILGTGYFHIGYQSDGNTVTIENSASIITTNNVNVSVGGNNPNGESNRGGSCNTLMIDASTALFGRTYLGMFSGASNNTIIVRNGGVLSATRLHIGYDSSSYPGSFGNNVTMIGSGSVVRVNGYFKIGQGGSVLSNNTLTIMNGAIACQDNTGANIEVGVGAENYVRLASGFVARIGNQTAMFTDAMIQVWNGHAWVAGVKGANWTAVYYANASDALAATGYNNLGGYTIYTGGKPVTPGGTVVLLF